MTADAARTEWTVHPEAEKLVEQLLAEAVADSPRLADLDARLGAQTSTRLFDWLDHVGAAVSDETLRSCGYVEGDGLWRHPLAQLPAIVPGPRAVALRVDDAAVFCAAQGGPGPAEGSPKSGFRRATVSGEEPVAVSGVERRSWGCGVAPQVFDDRQAIDAARARRLWAERPRFGQGASAVAETIGVAEEMTALAGQDLAASYALELERGYWQRRNTAAVVQHARQDRLGLGWGNNDHHTFRSSRQAFQPLIALFRALGFAVRERFYAGEEAGWGAQVMEHSGCGGVVFADVDLAPREVRVDFSVEPLPEAARLGTVGLWCALHGESILSAGMHHLEGQFDFDRLRADLAEAGIGHMRPFSDMPHLRQAFTEAERWPVAPDRLRRLVEAGRLDEEAARRFAAEGAAGSHLENLARRGGFKGFNQANVSSTMRATDPRRYQPT